MQSPTRRPRDLYLEALLVRWAAEATGSLRQDREVMKKVEWAVDFALLLETGCRPGSQRPGTRMGLPAVGEWPLLVAGVVPAMALTGGRWAVRC